MGNNASSDCVSSFSTALMNLLRFSRLFAKSTSAQRNAARRLPAVFEQVRDAVSERLLAFRSPPPRASRRRLRLGATTMFGRLRLVRERVDVLGPIVLSASRREAAAPPRPRDAARRCVCLASRARDRRRRP